MRRYLFNTVDVFTTTRFGGNPLAVFPDAAGLSDVEMQALAAEMNYSETTFVLPPQDPTNSARVRIFNRTAEMPFAGHPNVGTGYVLASQGRAPDDVLRFEEKAGLVEVRIARKPDGSLIGAEIDAPQPLQVLGELPAEVIASCIGVGPGDVRSNAHPPVRATVGVEFVLVEVAALALTRAVPDLAAFRQVAERSGLSKRMSIHLYARDEHRIHARMFAPIAGTWEDPATGSANAALGALLLSLSTEREAVFEVRQGIEMGRPSALRVSARRAGHDIHASVAGSCVPVLRGEAEI
jgi:trans-2,3-dihydro-3-hydroxyanthranilate isomerase